MHNCMLGPLSASQRKLWIGAEPASFRRYKNAAWRAATVGFWLFANALAAQNVQEIRGTQAHLSGRVFDSRTQAPLVGANVMVIPHGPGTATNANGEFVLDFSRHRAQQSATLHKVVEQGDSLRVSFMGYRPVTLALTDIGNDLQIQLEAVTLLFAETVVTATRQSALRAEVPSAIELVEIGSPHTVARQNVGEVLAQSQSVFIKEYGSVSGLKTINLRGAGDGQVLVLEDGVRLNNPQNGGVDAGVLSLVGIDKIEIVRGNASAQYGSDAIGGVIHLRSIAPPAGLSGGVQTCVGSFGAFNSRLQVGYGSNLWRGTVAVDRLVSDGDFAIDEKSESKRRNNASQRREIFARVSGNLLNDLRLNLLHRTSDTEQGVPGSLQFPSTVAQQKDVNHLTSTAVEWNGNPLLQFTAQFSAERRDQRYHDPSFFIASHHAVASDIATLQNRAQLSSALDLLIGGEIGNYRVNSTDLGKPQRTQRSTFVQIEWRPRAGQRHGGWQLTVIPSLRHDNYSDAGDRTSPKLALTLGRQFVPSHKQNTAGLSTARLSLHGSLGKSFRVPSMNDLWYQDPFFVGNPNLRPERGREVEGGVLYEFSHAGNWQLEFAAFDSKIEGLIVLTDQTFPLSLENLDDVEISGVELTAVWRSHGDLLGWRANYTRLSAKNASNNSTTNEKDLVYRPRDKFDLQTNFDLGYFTLSGSFQFVARRFINADNSTSLPAYRLTHLSIGRQIRLGEVHALLQAEVRNVFDKHFSIIDGYPMPGREFRATLKLGN